MCYVHVKSESVAMAKMRPLSRAHLDCTLETCFPGLHKYVGEKDRDAMVRMQLCPPEAIRIFVDNPSAAEHLTEIADFTRGLLISGKWTTSRHGCATHRRLSARCELLEMP